MKNVVWSILYEGTSYGSSLWDETHGIMDHPTDYIDKTESASMQTNPTQTTTQITIKNTKSPETNTERYMTNIKETTEL